MALFALHRPINLRPQSRGLVCLLAALYWNDHEELDHQLDDLCRRDARFDCLQGFVRALTHQKICYSQQVKKLSEILCPAIPDEKAHESATPREIYESVRESLGYLPAPLDLAPRNPNVDTNNNDEPADDIARLLTSEYAAKAPDSLIVVHLRDPVIRTGDATDTATHRSEIELYYAIELACGGVAFLRGVVCASRADSKSSVSHWAYIIPWKGKLTEKFKNSVLLFDAQYENTMMRVDPSTVRGDVQCTAVLALYDYVPSTKPDDMVYYTDIEEAVQIWSEIPSRPTVRPTVQASREGDITAAELTDYVSYKHWGGVVINLALLTANFSQLETLLRLNTENKRFHVLISLLAGSWFLQACIGICQLILLCGGLESEGRRLYYEQEARGWQLVLGGTSVALTICVGLCLMVNAIVPVLIQLQSFP